MQRNEYGLLDGTVTSVYGNIKLVTEYVNGLRHGIANMYRDDILVQTATFNHGEMVSVNQHKYKSENRLVITAENISNFRPTSGLIEVQYFCYANSASDNEVKLWLLNKNYKNSNLDYLKPKSHIYGILNGNGTGMAWNQDYAIMFSPVQPPKSPLASHFGIFTNIEVDPHVRECLDEIATEKKLSPETIAYLKLKCL